MSRDLVGGAAIAGRSAWAALTGQPGKALRQHDFNGREGGFTLIELVVVMVILPILISGLTLTIITLLKNTGSTDPKGTAARLADSHDAQVTSSYFVRDIQTAARISTNSAPVCAPSGSGQDQLLGVEGSTAAGKTTDVSYFIQQSPLEVVRYYCENHLYQSASVLSHDALNGLASVTPGPCPGSGFGSGASHCALAGPNNAHAAITVTCTNGGGVNCASGGMYPVVPFPGVVVGISGVQISILENGNTKFQYSLKGTPRLSTAAALGAPISAPLRAPFISNGLVSLGNCSLVANGVAAVNDSAAGSVTIGPKGSVAATSIYTTDPIASGSVNVTGTPPYPQPVISGAPISSPYDILTEPPTVPSGATYQIYDEGYGAAWDPSAAPQPLPAGIYVIHDGMTVKGGVDGSKGVLFYVEGGNVSLNGNGTIILNPLLPNWENGNPQPTPEVVLWISKNDTVPNNPPTLTLGGNGNTTTINGAVYAPTAAVTVNGTGKSGGVSTQGLDIGSLACNGGGAGAINLLVGSPLSSGTYVQATNPVVPVGQSNTASATVIGSGQLPPTGSVTFYGCGPEPIPSGCDNLTGVQAGPAATLATGGNGTSTAQSPAFQATVAGYYCVAGYYSGDSSFMASSDTSPDGCFYVSNYPSAPPAPIIISPVNADCYSSAANGTCILPWPGAITGSASAVPGGLPLARVDLSIEDTITNLYWNGSAFGSATPVAIPATDPSGTNTFASWMLGFSQANLTANHSYEVQATASDTGGATGPSATANFTWVG